MNRPNAPMIIDSPEKQSKAQKRTSRTLSVVFWALWIYLFLPLITAVMWLFSAREVNRQVAAQLPVTHPLFIVLFLGGAAFVFFLWFLYNRIRFRKQRRRGTLTLSASTKVSDFGLDPERNKMLLQQRKIQMSFDDYGRITQIQ